MLTSSSLQGFAEIHSESVAEDDVEVPTLSSLQRIPGITTRTG